MTKEEQIWRNSNNIAGQIFSLNNWRRILEHSLYPEDNSDLKKYSQEERGERIKKAIEELTKVASLLAKYNSENMNLTSKNSEL